MRKFGILAVAAMTLGLTATAVLPSTETTSAQASSIKVVWRKAMGSHTYQINTSKAKKAYAYSSSFKHVFKLSNYSGTVFYTKQHEKKLKSAASTIIITTSNLLTRRRLAGSTGPI